MNCISEILKLRLREENPEVYLNLTKLTVYIHTLLSEKVYLFDVKHKKKKTVASRYLASCGEEHLDNGFIEKMNLNVWA